MPNHPRSRYEKFEPNNLILGVFDDTRLSRNAKLLGVAIANVGQGRPSTRELLRVTAMSRPTFVRARRELERFDHLWLERRGRFIVRYVLQSPKGGNE